jgi:hypothetical protein
MWSPSKFIKMYRQCCGSGIRKSSVAEQDPEFGAFFALLITVMAWSFGYEYVVAK